MKYDLIDFSNKKRTEEEIKNIAKMLNDLEKLDNEIFEDIDLSKVQQLKKEDNF